MIEEYGDLLESITMLRGGSGRFEVRVDGDLIFSKKEVGRHAAAGEVVDLIRRVQAE